MSGEEETTNIVTGSDPAPPVVDLDAKRGEKDPTNEKGEKVGFELDLLSFKGLEDIPDLEWHIEGFIPKGGLTMIYGPPKSGKSFVVMSLVLALDHGGGWLGHPVVDRCRSLYIALEGRSGLKMRSEAWHEHYGHDVGAGNSLIQTGRVNLAEYEHTNAIIEAVIENGIEVVIFDTLARATAGMEENSAKDMGRVIGEADRIREETGATVILVHHTGHGDTHRGRGTSALPGAVDSAIMVKAGKVSAELLKDSETPEPVHFKLEPVAQSVVALPMSSRAVDDSGDTSEDVLRHDLEKFQEALESEGAPRSKNALMGLVVGNRTRLNDSISVWLDRGFLTQIKDGRSLMIGLPEWESGI